MLEGFLPYLLTDTETFTFADEGTGVSLNDVARLHNLVTVVDAASVIRSRDFCAGICF